MEGFEYQYQLVTSPAPVQECVSEDFFEEKGNILTSFCQHFLARFAVSSFNFFQETFFCQHFLARFVVSSFNFFQETAEEQFLPISSKIFRISEVFKARISLIYPWLLRPINCYGLSYLIKHNNFKV